ncbi:class I SAM-dependent methyltransferase [Paenibacillus nanensis]|uniref:Class I SAM-dependent methyltransferase n=1 Tax=Paenibacillus nanensis TaxID=393251 RepID=A0A3A1UP25_9BACL|nr:class I SAM-dependent methyltransferase [Paenibacillus nanensis]RIX49995.1 class I SAM-dependent methyltransferase [Paenibacillus nanensis]
MLHTLALIEAYRMNRLSPASLSEHPWLLYLTSAEERVVNVERMKSLKELSDANLVLDYVERSLRLLDAQRLSFWMKELLEEVLCWSEAAKGGTARERLRWQGEGVNVHVHNVGSAQLYERTYGLGAAGSRQAVVRCLIEAHGLVGQQIRGEVPASDGIMLYELVRTGALTPDELERLLLALNHCVIGAVSDELWESVKPEAQTIISAIAQQGGAQEETLCDRFRRMRAVAASRGEAFDETFDSLTRENNLSGRFDSLQHKTFWYAEPATQDFALEDFLKIMALTATDPIIRQARHISFERLMRAMYYDYRGVKKVNVYKLRIIEKYLRELSWQQQEGWLLRQGEHLRVALEAGEPASDTVFFEFVFSPAAEKLIEFCVEAEKSALYEHAVLMLFDLFDLRRDAYDRFHNEADYLADMNSSADYKRVLLDYVVGTKVVDIGPGGGVLLDLLEEERPGTEPIGIDIASNVVEALNRKKQLENRRWEVKQGDALRLQELLGPESVDTVIFSSILHELYSYIPFEGSKFNVRTIEAALVSAFEILKPGGRILIRDGVMTEPDGMRRIRFLREDGMSWLERYARDFKGRTIRYEKLSDQEAQMPVNDAMEFLYTYTWGEEAYVHEVQEQFGCFTLSAYENCIVKLFGGKARIVVSRAYLQAGYTEALAEKIRFMDDNGAEVPLPDSTCLLVVEKN